jgi:flagellar L-ring protein precursor FlgH
MNRNWVPVIACAAAVSLAGGVRAQSTETPSDSAGGITQSATARASWVSDRTAFRVGEILTVILDEQTSARERVSQVATADRSQRANAGLQINFDSENTDGTGNFEAGLKGESRDVGELNRRGDLSGVLSVRVIAVGPDGVAEIEGSKVLDVDGRKQETSLHGFVRPEDVSASNIVFSSCIAGAEISYKGKKMKPRRGIIGRIVSLLWP